MSSVIEVKGRNFQVNEFIATVVEIQTEQNVEVWGNAQDVRSSTTTKVRLFLVDDEGREAVRQAVNLDLAARKGHRLRILSMSRPGEKAEHYVAIKNMTTGNITWDKWGLSKVARCWTVAGSSLGAAKVLTLFLLLVVFYAPLVLPLLIAMGYFLWHEQHARGAVKRLCQQLALLLDDAPGGRPLQAHPTS